MSIKALAIAVLQGNQQENQRETKSFLGRKLRKPARPPRKLEVKHKIVQNSEPQWQYDFCTAHAIFNNWRGSCPCSLDECPITRIIEANNDINNLRGVDLGREVTTDQVIDEWLNSGEPAEDTFKNPTWLVCMAESLFKQTTEGKRNDLRH